MIKQEWETEDTGLEHTLIIHSSKPHKFEEQQKEQKFVNIYDTLHSANPILPPGMYNEKDRKLAYKYNIHRQGLNKTAFPQVIKNKKKFDSSLTLPIKEENEERYKSSKKSQFDQFIYNKKVLYKRFNNEQFNKIGIDNLSHFSSFFFNIRKQQIKSKTKTIFEHLSKSHKEMEPVVQVQHVLNFRSDFQSANLFCALLNDSQTIPTYELYMQNDINTKGCTQWFFFCVQPQRRLKVKIRIMNFYKPTSLYMKGMKVLVSKDKNEWKRTGTAIKYSRIGLREGKCSYAMQFIYDFQTPLEPYYFSYGYPYTYTNLKTTLTKFVHDNAKNKIVNKSLLCESYLGNQVYMLNISNDVFNSMNKPIIYVIGRQHPGQTPASFIVEGIIKTLLSNRTEMIQLRNQFLIKVIPMVNVDGVINGNYRSNISGNDINRQWLFPSKKLHPEVFYLKEEILRNKKNVCFFLDVHAHSRKMNSFFYGSSITTEENRFYPFVTSKLCKFINYNDCTFWDDPSKKTTARVVIQSETGVKNSLTFEASFYGWEEESKKLRHHFNLQNFENIGECLALGLFYSEIGVKKWCQKNGKELNSVSCELERKTKQNNSEIDLKIEKNCFKLYQKWNKQLQKLKKTKTNEVMSEGSSLDPEHFQLKQEEEEELWFHPMKEEIQDEQKDREIVEKNEQSFFQSKSKNFNKMDLKMRKVGITEQQKKIELYKSLVDNRKSYSNALPSFYPVDTHLNLKNSLMVKQLESELQLNADKQRRYQTIEERESKLKILPQYHKRTGFRSIEGRNESNYKQNILQMKNALKYYISQKEVGEVDYQNYKTFIKNGIHNKSLVFREKDRFSPKKKGTKK